MDICVPLHATTDLCPVKNPTRQEAGEPQILHGHSGEEKSLLPLLCLLSWLTKYLFLLTKYY